MDADGDRLLAHIKLTHKMLAQLVEIIDMLWEYVAADRPELTATEDALRMEQLIRSIRRITDPGKDN